MIDEKKLIEDILWKVKEQVFVSEEVGHNRPFCDKANVIECINNQPKIGEWVSCSEPPKDDKEVLIDNGKSYSVGYYDGKTWANAIHPVRWKPIEP